MSTQKQAGDRGHDAVPAAADVATAARLYARLPAEGRSALRTIEALAGPAELTSAMHRIARVLIDTAWDIASRKAAEQAKLADSLDSEAAVEAAAVRLTRAAQR